MNNEILYEGDFPGIEKAAITDLRKPWQIQLSRQAWLSHLNRTGHFNSYEEVSEVLNDPDLILHQERLFRGNVVQFMIKDVTNVRPRVVIVFTNEEGTHKVASAYYLDRKKLGNYISKHTIIFQR